MDKYEMIPENGMFRIKALKDFGRIKAGDLGGLIKREGNLSQIGETWVYGNAEVSGNARVSGNAQVLGDAWVYGDAHVYGKAEVSGNAQVYGNTLVYGDAQVSGNALVYGDAQVSGNALVSGNARVSGIACVYGDAHVYGDMWILYGGLNHKCELNSRDIILVSMNILPNIITGVYTVYKRVNKITEGSYSSVYDSSVVYKDGESYEVLDYDPDMLISCGRGIHVSNPNYCFEGNTLIQVSVYKDDVITCLQGKMRVKKIFVVGEVKE